MTHKLKTKNIYITHLTMIYVYNKKLGREYKDDALVGVSCGAEVFPLTKPNSIILMYDIFLQFWSLFANLPTTTNQLYRIHLNLIFSI